MGKVIIYPDVIESGLGDSATIKSHHNVGRLPDHINFGEIVVPVKMPITHSRTERQRH